MTCVKTLECLLKESKKAADPLWIWLESDIIQKWPNFKIFEQFTIFLVSKEQGFNDPHVDCIFGYAGNAFAYASVEATWGKYQMVCMPILTSLLFSRA